VRSHLLQVAQAEAQRPLDEARHAEAELGSIEDRNLKMIANVEPCVRHHDAAEEARNRRFAVERMRPMHDEAGGDRLLAGFFRIQGRHVVAGRQRRAAATAGNDASARGGGVDVEAAGHLERLHELAHTALVACLDDQIQRMFTVHHRFTLDLDAVLPHVGTTEMVEEHRSHVGIQRRATLGCVLMPHYEQRHGLSQS
jgi:hypothetical protein